MTLKKDCNRFRGGPVPLSEIGLLVVSRCARSRNAQNAGACLLRSIDDGETARKMAPVTDVFIGPGPFSNCIWEESHRVLVKSGGRLEESTARLGYRGDSERIWTLKCHLRTSPR
jgi:hypothetical protein